MKEIEFGDKVICTQIMRRGEEHLEIAGRKRSCKVYKPKMTGETEGIYLGTRMITNGYTVFEYEYTYWVTLERIKVALVAFSSRKNPSYVPLCAIQKRSEGV